MEHEYKDLKSQSIESGIIFYGLESCKPNYTYKGNNVRKNYVIHYIEEGKDLVGKGFDPRKLLKPGTEAIKQTVRDKMEMFGSIGKAE